MVKQVFYSHKENVFEELSVQALSDNSILIEIKDPRYDNYHYDISTYLDLDTAIKFSKELRRQIALIKNSEQ